LLPFNAYESNYIPETLAYSMYRIDAYPTNYTPFRAQLTLYII